VTADLVLDVPCLVVRPPGEPDEPPRQQVGDGDQHGHGSVQMRRSGGESESGILSSPPSTQPASCDRE
jgi:hypothetical protein